MTDNTTIFKKIYIKDYLINTKLLKINPLITYYLIIYLISFTKPKILITRFITSLIKIIDIKKIITKIAIFQFSISTL